jgi:predicted RNA polymerase sigma factor
MGLPVLAHLFERLGDAGRAIDHYRAAAAHADNETERHYLVGKAAALAGG